MAPPGKATQRTVSGGGTCSLLRRARPGTGGEWPNTWMARKSLPPTVPFHELGRGVSGRGHAP